MSDPSALHLSDGSLMECLRCHGPMHSLGEVDFVTGGSSAGAKMFFGQWAEMGEKNWTLNAVRCDQCGHVEFFDRQRD